MQMTSEKEFTQAYEQFRDAIFRHCYFRVSSRELAVDLMQQTFLRAWQSMVKGEKIENIRAFLYRIANNLVIDETRKHAIRHVSSLDTLEAIGREPGHDPRTQLHTQIEGARIRPYLDQLDADDRDLLILRYIDDLSPKEIGSILQETPNVISVRLNRALKKFRSLLPHPYVVR